MDSPDDPRDSSLVASLLVRTIRRQHRGSLEEVARRLGLSEKTLRRWDRGTFGASPRNLARLAREAGYSPALVQGLVRLLGLLRLAEAEASPASSPDNPMDAPMDAEIAAAASTAAQEAHGLLPIEPSPDSWEEQPADLLWSRYTSRDQEQQRQLVRESSIFHTRSFCERLCRESVDVAPDSPADALNLAELAVEVARKIRGTNSERAGWEAYARGHLANVRRVTDDPNGANVEFDRVAHLLTSGEKAPLSPTAKSRLLDLEASLRRDQRRFPKALALLQEALDCGPAESKGRILIKKAFTLEQMGAYEESLATLNEATPHVEAHGTLRDLFAWRFNTAVNRCHLGQAEKAQTILPEIQALAERLDNTFDRLRTRWLEARVTAGLGRTQEAIVQMDRLCEEFLRSDPPRPYDAALAGLDLARYWLKEENTAAVKQLAPSLERIFRAKGIRREALASLRLFCEAARREGATLELIEKVTTEVERAGRK